MNGLGSLSISLRFSFVLVLVLITDFASGWELDVVFAIGLLSILVSIFGLNSFSVGLFVVCFPLSEEVLFGIFNENSASDMIFKSAAFRFLGISSSFISEFDFKSDSGIDLSSAAFEESFFGSVDKTGEFIMT